MDILPPLAHHNIRSTDEQAEIDVALDRARRKRESEAKAAEAAATSLSFTDLRLWSDTDKTAFRLLALRRDGFYTSYDDLHREPKPRNSDYPLANANPDRATMPKPANANYTDACYCSSCNCWCIGEGNRNHTNCSQHQTTTTHRRRCDLPVNKCTCDCGCTVPTRVHLVRNHENHMSRKTHKEWFAAYTPRKEAAYAASLAGLPNIDGFDLLDTSRSLVDWYERWVIPPNLTTAFHIADERDLDYPPIVKGRAQYQRVATKKALSLWDRGNVDECYTKLDELVSKWNIWYGQSVKAKMVDRKRKRIEEVALARKRRKIVKDRIHNRQTILHHSLRIPDRLLVKQKWPAYLGVARNNYKKDIAPLINADTDEAYAKAEELTTKMVEKWDAWIETL